MSLIPTCPKPGPGRGPVDDLAAFLDAWRAAGGGPVVAEVGGVQLRASVLQAVLAIAADDLAELELPVRFHNALRQARVHTIGQLATRTAEQLLGFRNIGVAGVATIRAALAEHGLHLADTPSGRTR